MDFSEKPPMKDDALWPTLFIITGILKYKFVVNLFVAAFVIRIGVYCVELCTMCMHPEYFIRYGPWMMAEPFGLLAIAYILKNIEFINQLWIIFNRWSLDSAGVEVEKSIKAKIRNHYSFLVITLTLGGMFAIISLYPNPTECDIFLDMYLFSKHYPEYSRIYNLISKLSFAPSAFSMLALVLTLCYGSEHCVYQWHLLTGYIRNITVEYDGTHEIELLNDENYQIAVKNRLKFCVARHVEFLVFARKVNENLIQSWYLPVSLFAYLFMLFLTMNMYGIYVGTFAKTFLNVGSLVSLTCTALICFVNTVHAGQHIEDESEHVLEELVQSFRWTSYNGPNRISILIILIQSQRPIKIRFTQDISCNYALGLEIAKGVYSTLSILMSIRSN